MVAKHEPSLYAQHLGRPQVLGLIEGLFPRTLQRADIEDLRQTALVAALKVSHPPSSPDECTALACKIANDTLHEHFRTSARHARFDVGLCEDADEHPACPGAQADPCLRLDLAKLLDCLHRLVEKGHITGRQLGIWTRAVHGVARTEIAQELGLAHSTVRNEACNARKALKASWVACAGTAALLTITAVWWWVSQGDRVAQNSDLGPRAEPVPVQTATPSPPPRE